MDVITPKMHKLTKVADCDANVHNRPIGINPNISDGTIPRSKSGAKVARDRSR